MSYHRRYFADATILDSHRRIIDESANACALEIADIVDAARERWEAARRSLDREPMERFSGEKVELLTRGDDVK